MTLNFSKNESNAKNQCVQQQMVEITEKLYRNLHENVKKIFFLTSSTQQIYKDNATHPHTHIHDAEESVQTRRDTLGKTEIAK